MSKALIALFDFIFLLSVGAISAIAFDSMWAAIGCIMVAAAYSVISYTDGFMRAKSIFGKDRQ